MARIKAGNSLSKDAQVIDFGASASLTESDGHVTVSGLGGSGLPTGGTTGQVLDKLSNADGDAGWTTPATASNNTPKAASGSGSPGTGTNFARDDHVHPAVAVPSALDAYWIITTQTPASGDRFGMPYATSSLTTSDSRGWATPIRLSTSQTVYLGINIKAAGTASVSVTRLGIFADDANGLGPGTLVADLGTVDSGSTGTKFTTSSVALTAGTRYWALCVSQGAPAANPTFGASPVLVGLGNALDGTSVFAPTVAYYNGISGALASNPTLTAWTVNNPAMFFVKIV